MKRDHDAKLFDVAALAIAVALFAVGMVSAAETAKPIHLRLAYSAITVNQAIPWISYEAGHLPCWKVECLAGRMIWLLSAA